MTQTQSNRYPPNSHDVVGAPPSAPVLYKDVKGIYQMAPDSGSREGTETGWTREDCGEDRDGEDYGGAGHGGSRTRCVAGDAEAVGH